MSDVIYALATPPGRSGVAVVRLSGEGALQIANAMCGELSKPRHAYYRTILSSDGQPLDDALVLYFQAPASFTGEDVIELQIHGGRAVIQSVLARLSQFENARPANPGEFTRRALENGKLDMLQVEALGDFIEADTEAQRQASFQLLRGSGGAWAVDLRDKLVEAMSLVTASIDFSDEDLPENLVKSIGYAIEMTREAILKQIELTAKQKSLRQGFRVAIIGKPNVGKSSLINELAGREVAISTDIPGTTRDVLEVFLDVGGLPLVFYDTAGLRETEDKVEAIGVSRALVAAEEADLRIFLYEEKTEIETLGVKPEPHDLIIQSKSDKHGTSANSVSTTTKQGIDELLSRVSEYFADQTSEQGYFSHERQENALKSALLSLEDANRFYLEGEIVYELLAEAMRQAVFALDLLVGKVDVEDMLDVIFSKFCIGK